jgi:large subunit ribosomal protein L17
MRVIRSRDVAAKVFGELADRFRSRAGGYTRVLKTRFRVGDAAQMSLVALLGADEGPQAVATTPGGKPAPRKQRGAKRAAGGAGKAAGKTAQGEGKAASAKKKKASGKKSGAAKASSAAASRSKAASRAKPKATRRKAD